MTYNSPFELCRKITVSFADDSKTAKNKNRIIFIILSCRNLFDFDIFLHLQKGPTPDERTAWTILARHLSSQPLRTLRIRLKWAKHALLPVSFTPTEASNQSGLSFDILRNRLTHLSLELNYPDIVFATEPDFSNFEHLKFFAIYVVPGRHYLRHSPEGISRLLQSVQVEEMGFSWPLRITTLPLTLTKLSIIRSANGFQLLPILKQLVNLEILTSTSAQHCWANPDEVEPIRNQSVENEVIGCRRLRVFHFNDDAPKFLFQIIASQCPLLSDIKLNHYVPKNEVFAVIEQCKALHSITLDFRISNDVFSYLCFSKNLVNITLEIMNLPNVVMLKSLLKELPLLRRLYIWDWFEDALRDQFERAGFGLWLDGGRNE